MHRASRVFVAAIGSFGLYLFFAGAVSMSEAAAGVVSAGLATAYTVLLRRSQHRPMQLRGLWSREVGQGAIAVLTDSLRVAQVLLQSFKSPRAGSVERQAFEPGGDTPAEAGRRAIVTLARSLSPSGFALDIAPSVFLAQDAGMLMHRLSPNPDNHDAAPPV